MNCPDVASLCSVVPRTSCLARKRGFPDIMPVEIPMTEADEVHVPYGVQLCVCRASLLPRDPFVSFAVVLSRRIGLEARLHVYKNCWTSDKIRSVVKVETDTHQWTALLLSQQLAHLESLVNIRLSGSRSFFPCRSPEIRKSRNCRRLRLGTAEDYLVTD
jgi:hypothetical protein